MATQISSDESSRDDEFDWDSYLVDTRSEAAPAENFKQSLIPPANEFVVGEKLETIDPRNQDSWCIGTIIDKDGPRLRIRLDGTDDRNDFWRMVDSNEIRVYGTTAKYGGQIVPPLGFQQTSTRWAKYFDKNVKNGPFAAESCFKPQPAKPERNFFRKGQKLEAVDPKHPQFICPATVNGVASGDYRIVIGLDGWSSSNNFKVDYYSRDIFPVGWCQAAGIRLCPIGGNPSNRISTKNSTTPNKTNRTIQKKTISPQSNDSSYSPTTMDEKNNNLVNKSKSTKTSEEKRERRNSIDFDDHQENLNEKKQPIVTVYLNYTGDNSGIILNPQKFRFLMPSIFGPDQCSVVLTSILDSCIKCTFQPPSFISRIRDLFPTPSEEKKTSLQKIKLENNTEIYVPQMKTSDDFWDVIRTVQIGILAGQDLFISTPPLPTNQSNGSSSSFLDSSVSPDKKDSSPLYRPLINEKTKRKSTEFLSQTENRSFVNNGKVPRSNSSERSAHETKSAIPFRTSIDVKPSCTSIVSNGAGKRRPERFTPNEVADFVRNIDPTFDSLATRFLQEEIDGKALLLLNTDTLMRHMGLKLGPSLKIVHHIEQLKKS